MVMQRLAKPSTPVRFRPPPPYFQVARVVKLVDTADLKSAAYLNKGRAGSIPAPGTRVVKIGAACRYGWRNISVKAC